MRFWLNRTAEIPLRQQLVTQIVLGILGRELQPGQKLPSTRELARRFGIHANTASAAFKELEADGWLEFRHGSGVYVRARRPDAALSPELAADELIGEMAARAKKAGVPPHMLRERMMQWAKLAPPDRWLLLEPDPELRRIVLHELSAAVRLPVSGCGPEDCAAADVRAGAMVLVLPSKAASVRKLLPAGSELTVLEVHPVAPALGGYLPAPAGVLVGIASRWSEFQRIARTMLIAAGMPPESLLVCDATQPGWKRGLSATAAVICDAVTASELPKECRAIEFRLIAEPMLRQLLAAEDALHRWRV